jgi:hypothetical protein
MPTKKLKSTKKKIKKKTESKPKSLKVRVKPKKTNSKALKPKKKSIPEAPIDLKEKLEFENVLKEHKDLIKKLEYKKYKTSIELIQIIDTLIVFFNSNKIFREYCKKVRISSYLLSKDVSIP